MLMEKPPHTKIMLENQKQIQNIEWTWISQFTGLGCGRCRCSQDCRDGCWLNRSVSLSDADQSNDQNECEHELHFCVDSCGVLLTRFDAKLMLKLMALCLSIQQYRYNQLKLKLNKGRTCLRLQSLCIISMKKVLK